MKTSFNFIDSSIMIYSYVLIIDIQIGIKIVVKSAMLVMPKVMNPTLFVGLSLARQLVCDSCDNQYEHLDAAETMALSETQE